MEAICALSSLRGSIGRGGGIISSTISPDQRDFWVRSHPGRNRFDFAVGQDIEHTMTLEINQQCSVRTPSLERKVINAQLNHLPNRGGWESHDPPENGLPRGLDA